MKKKLFLSLALTGLLLLAACGGAPKDSNSAGADMPASSAPDAELGGWGLDSQESTPMKPAGESSGGAVYQDPNAKLIRRAQLHIQTETFDRAAGSLDKLVTDCGGYFENAVVYGGSYRNQNANRSGEYTVRIPAEQYDRFLDQSGGLGYVTSRDESSENVGMQYHDAETRLKTQRTKQERLLSLLEKAETMEDIIALESALSEVEYQIEQYSSTLNRYDGLIGFSTFTIYLEEVTRVTEEVGEAASLGDRMGAGVRASLDGLVEGTRDLLVWISYNLFLVAVVATVVAAGAVMGVRRYRRRKKPDVGTDEKK